MLKIIKSQQGGNTLSKLQRSTERQCYTMLALPLIGFFVFTLYPMGWAISKAFYYFNNIPNETKYVGLKNFVDIFTRDAVFWKTWVTTFEFALLKLPFEVPMALVLAVLLSKINKGKSLFRTAYFVPSVIATSLSAVIFNNLFQYFGFFNDILMKLGWIAKPIDWYANRGFAMIMLVIGSVWSSFGINVLYFTAALSNVPKDVYEAASLDGAGPVQSFFFITIPMIAPVFQTILLLAINGTLHTAEYVLVMTGGGPGNLTHTSGSYIFANYAPGYAEPKVNIGYGCALSLVSAVIFALVAILFNKFSERMKNVY